ncbi:hypothetical protein AR457_36455 [Streptomyces agglomeratus]|uniref:Uncharacterized protein n=1 Tax=Streptomyces agglomeratus TaxID=285458 RepID=A0A1E5NYE7_9ACTN|nr:hypothetical protein AS594_37675 [Streptomyces agglomeratus]OEJ22764.1 hypothetical protein AR457_36455 [Streptomyces agglomeratus]OEJ36708.1 hypothetical protein BGK72_36820 [Streptomyces agglomeratus]
MEEVFARLGWAWEPREVTPGRRPVMEIAGIDQRLIGWQLTRRQQIEDALSVLLERAEPPTAPGWGKTWSLLRNDCSTSTKDQVKAALPAHFPGRVAAVSARRRSLPQSVPLPHRDRGLRAEHIPQWLPDQWFAAMYVTTSPRSMRQSRLFRRFAAIQLVMDTARMSADEGIRYLGIPDSWREGPARQRKLLPLGSCTSRPDLASAFDRLSQHISEIHNPVDYRRRRLFFADWTLTPRAWDPIAQQIRAHGRHFRFRFHAQIQDAASSFVWAQVAGGEPSLAPSAQEYLCVRHHPDQQKFALSLQRIRSPGKSIRYQTLHGLLMEYANTLATACDGG